MEKWQLDKPDWFSRFWSNDPEVVKAAWQELKHELLVRERERAESDEKLRKYYQGYREDVVTK